MTDETIGGAVATDAVTTEDKKTDAPTSYEVVGVSFRPTGKVYYFDPRGKKFEAGATVIVDTARGAEFGYVSAANRMVRASEVILPLRRVVRATTADDLARHEKNKQVEREAAAVFPAKAAAFKLDMKFVDAEYAFDGSKLVIYFTAENRVDFRELVKDLASVFRCRIELRQIGIRDEAKMLGGIGPCGRPFCCSTFLTDFGQVSIKMAKEQNFSLNSTKISGCCGRLMCCLRFEHETYEEAHRTMPRMGAAVMTENGPGVVIELKPLTQSVKVRLDDKQEAPKSYDVSEITVIRKNGGKNEKNKRESDDSNGNT